MSQLLVYGDLLPEDAGKRHSALRDYFCDKDATALLRDGHWELDLHWPGGLDRHVDPRLGEGLLWWGEGVEPETMRLARRRDGRVVRALFDSWTVHAWSEWAARAKPDVAPVILHVDDHRDTMSPRIFFGPDGWLDPLAGRDLIFDDPASVAVAIESGAIGMGSFMTIMLHRFPGAEVRHLCQPPKVTATRDWTLGVVMDDGRDAWGLARGQRRSPIAGGGWTTGAPVGQVAHEIPRHQDDASSRPSRAASVVPEPAAPTSSCLGRRWRAGRGFAVGTNVNRQGVD